jgi:hypothetical protein
VWEAVRAVRRTLERTMLTATIATIGNMLAARGSGRFVGKLIAGDPVAWTILGGMVVVMGGVALVRKMRQNKGQ